jgi:PqqA peptide cyclase
MSAPQPLSLLAELTYRCNLQCPYCYNPLDLHAYRDELDEPDWLRVIDQAAALGVLQVHFSGGEPTLRPDLLVALVRRARERQLYSNLITQGTFLDDALLDRLLAAGLDHVQISLQGVDAAAAARIAGTDVHDRKIAALERVLAREVAVTLNYPLHRQNIETVADAIELAERLGVRRLELANVQLYGWAYLNRAGLLPSRDQVEAANAIVRHAQDRLTGNMEITYVLSDYYEQYPKPCMHGWGQRFMTVVPDGRVLPCPAAAAISTLAFESVRDASLEDIWQRSRAFEMYRGTAWMPEPCRSCPRKEIDFGGCRCQAFLLTGEASATDPVCVLSPQHSLVEAALSAKPAEALTPRRIHVSS